MKNLCLALALIFSLSVFSQDDDAMPTDKGSFLVNGAMDFNISSSKLSNSIIEDVRRLSFSLTPRVGYFITDGLAIGLEASFRLSREKVDYIGNGGAVFPNVQGLDDQITNTSTYALGPFVRYYFKNGIYAEAGIGYSRQNTDYEDELQNLEIETEFFSYEIGAGYALFFNNSVSLEPFLSYQFESQTQNENETDTSGLNLGVGFTFYF